MSFKTSLLDYIRRALTIEVIDGRLATWLGNHSDSYWVRRAVPGPALYAKGTERRAKRHGVEFRLDISDYQDWSIYFYNLNDNSRGLLEHIRPGNVVIDIGGNIGQTALWMADKVGSDGLVMSFEPFPKSIARFEFNHSLNSRLTNLSLIKCGLGSRVDKLEIQEDSRNSGANRITSGVDSDSSDIFEIDVTTLDRFLERNPIDRRIDFIKIDVEGYEFHVLKGARQTLELQHPTLFIEVDDGHLRDQGSRAEDVLQYVRGLGYTIIDTSTGIDLSVSGETCPHTDILCVFER